MLGFFSNFKENKLQMIDKLPIENILFLDIETVPQIDTWNNRETALRRSGKGSTKVQFSTTVA